MLFWRGWGILVFVVPFAWIFVLIGVVIGMDYHEPDPGKVAVMIYRLGALAFALAAVTLLAVERYRSRAAPGADDFAFIPMTYWPWLVTAGALGLFVASFFNPAI